MPNNGAAIYSGCLHPSLKAPHWLYHADKTLNLPDWCEKLEKAMDLKMNYELNDLFTKKYNTCITKTECYDLNEYLQPSFTGYEDKTILRINATLNYDGSSSINDDLISLISKYGQIVYTIGDKTYTSNNITATNFEIKKDNKNYYMEVSKKLKDATKIDIVLNIRNNKYVYNLKK